MTSASSFGKCPRFLMIFPNEFPSGRRPRHVGCAAAPVACLQIMCISIMAVAGQAAVEPVVAAVQRTEVVPRAYHTAQAPTKAPDFFLAATTTHDDAGLQRALTSVRQGPAAADALQIDTRATTLARDQSSLAALNIAGLVALDSTFALSMSVVTIAIFVFGLLLQRRREYITLRAQGLEPRTIRLLIAAEASTVAVGGAAAGLLVGAAMGYYFVTVLRPLFVLDPSYTLSPGTVATPVLLVLVATVVSAIAASRLVNRLDPTELLRELVTGHMSGYAVAKKSASMAG